uniref:SP110 nuclear body protein, tandem duplicate 1 n=1 Tax=Labrus bergylta TaxID=56723 RepID=A0A3Q3MXP8_9LABR
IWTWPINKFQIPVTCGKKEGMLNRDRLAKGQSTKCIAVGREWFTPPQFESFAGKENCRNWKTSIRCENVCLGKLIKMRMKMRRKMRRKSRVLQTQLLNMFSPPGDCGKSIRTETSWMTPLEFVTWASHQTDPSWRRDIMWEGNPLCERILQTHSLNCSCELCMPGLKDLNDDECFICKREGEELVVCDICPLSFHQKCHLPPFFFYVFALHPQLKDYSTIIQMPMWTGKVTDKLQNNLYQTVGEFVSDVQLIFTNSAFYNLVSKRANNVSISKMSFFSKH